MKWQGKMSGEGSRRHPVPLGTGDFATRFDGLGNTLLDAALVLDLIACVLASRSSSGRYFYCSSCGSESKVHSMRSTQEETDHTLHLQPCGSISQYCVTCRFCSHLFLLVGQQELYPVLRATRSETFISPDAAIASGLCISS